MLKIHDVEPVEPPDLDDSDPSPVPGQIVTDRHAVVVRVGDGWLRLVTVQPEGKQRVDASAWANGARLAVDDRLGE